MKIAIEAQRIFRKEKHGMDYVALETIRELQKIDTNRTNTSYWSAREMMFVCKNPPTCIS